MATYQYWMRREENLTELWIRGHEKLGYEWNTASAMWDLRDGERTLRPRTRPNGCNLLLKWLFFFIENGMTSIEITAG